MKRIGLAVASCVVLVGTSVAQQPSNDACQNAILLQNGINPGAPNGASGSFFSNVGSLGNDVPGFCTAGTDTKDVWFQWYSTGSGTATVTTCTPLGFTPGTAAVSIEAYAWCQGPVSACSQPACGGAGTTLSMTVLFGGLYLIRVATIAPTTGGGTFYLTLTSPPSPPLNDNLLGAFQVYPGTNPASGTYTTVAATPDGTGACTAAGEIDVWFRYQPGTSGTATLGTPGSILGLRITTAAGAVVACGTTSFPVAFPVTGGTQYFIRMASQVGAGTNFTITMVPPAPPPPNDECANAILLVAGANGPFAASNATPSPGSFSCTGAPDVWYSFTTGPCPSFYTFESTGGFGLTDACAPNPQVWFCSTQGGWSGGSGGSAGGSTGGPGPTAVFIPTTANTTYRLSVPANAAHTITITQGVHLAPAPQTYLGFYFTSPFGPGSIQVTTFAGPPNGVWYLAVTLNQGSFPNGAVYGLDITTAEVVAQFMTGPPFTGSFDACGNFELGPFAGLPSGLTVFSVLFGFAGGYSQTPTIYSLPTVYVIP